MNKMAVTHKLYRNKKKGKNLFQIRWCCQFSLKKKFLRRCHKIIDKPHGKKIKTFHAQQKKKTILSQLS